VQSRRLSQLCRWGRVAGCAFIGERRTSSAHLHRPRRARLDIFQSLTDTTRLHASSADVVCKRSASSGIDFGAAWTTVPRPPTVTTRYVRPALSICVFRMGGLLRIAVLDAELWRRLSRSACRRAMDFGLVTLGESPDFLSSHRCCDAAKIPQQVRCNRQFERACGIPQSVSVVFRRWVVCEYCGSSMKPCRMPYLGRASTFSESTQVCATGTTPCNVVESWSSNEDIQSGANPR